MLGSPCTAGTGPQANAVCSIAGSPVVITCSAPRIVAGFAAVTGSLVARVTDSVGNGQITLPGQLTSDTPDPTLSNNTTSQTLTPQVVADTSITKTLITNRVIAGEPVSYLLTATNNCPSDAPDVTFSDTLPDGTSFAGGTVVNVSGSCSSGTQGTGATGAAVVTCSVGQLNVGASTSVVLTLNTSAAIGPDPNNTGSVGSSRLDPLIDNNSSIAATTVSPPPTLSESATPDTDVAVSLKAAKSPIGPGDTAGYVATVHNKGPSTAGSVVLTTTLPAELAAVRSGVTRTGISTTVRDTATAAATNPQTVTAHARARVDAVIPPQCSTPSLRFGPPTAVAAC